MKCCFLILLAFVSTLISLGVCKGSENGIDPAARDLTSLASTLESGKGGVESLETEIRVRGGNEGIAVMGRVARTGPSWLLLVDQFDHTPILACSGGRAILYDLGHGCVHFFEHANFEVLAYYNHDQIGIDYRLTAAPNRICLDVPSLLKAGSHQPTASKDGDHCLLEGTTPSGGLLIARVKPKERFAFEAIRFYARGETNPRIAIDPMDVNGAPLRSMPELPDDHALARNLRVVKHVAAAATPADGSDEVAIAIRTLAYRVGLHDAAARDRSNRQTGDQVRWDLIAETDRQFSPILRGLIPRLSTTQPTDGN